MIGRIHIELHIIFLHTKYRNVGLVVSEKIFFHVYAIISQ